MMMSPLPLWIWEPVRPRPMEARFASRFNWRASTGASVATMIIMEPSGFSFCISSDCLQVVLRRLHLHSIPRKPFVNQAFFRVAEIRQCQDTDCE